MPNTTLGEQTADDGSTQDDLVHLLQQPHRTEIRKATERVVMTEVQKGSKQNLLVTVGQEKRTDHRA